MGYDEHGVRFLMHALDLGVDYSTTATIGHQRLFHMGVPELAAALAATGLDRRANAAELRKATGGHLNGILQVLGAETVDVVDASEYEGAQIIQDLNQPIPASLEGRYSAVVEGGTLEHVFNIATSLDNLMRMVKPGGHLLMALPTNDFAGHGFYQFSPELLFRALSPAYGYEIRESLVMERGHARPRWYRAADPAVVGRRLAFRTDSATELDFVAQRVGEVPGFESAPMQSDYETRWEEHASGASGPGGATQRTTQPPMTRRLVRHSISSLPPGPRRYGRWAVPWSRAVDNYRTWHPGFELVKEPWTV